MWIQTIQQKRRLNAIGWHYCMGKQWWQPLFKSLSLLIFQRTSYFVQEVLWANDQWQPLFTQWQPLFNGFYWSFTVFQRLLRLSTRVLMVMFLAQSIVVVKCDWRWRIVIDIRLDFSLSSDIDGIWAIAISFESSWWCVCNMSVWNQKTDDIGLLLGDNWSFKVDFLSRQNLWRDSMMHRHDSYWGSKTLATEWHTFWDDEMTCWLIECRVWGTALPQTSS